MEMKLKKWSYEYVKDLARYANNKSSFLSCRNTAAPSRISRKNCIAVDKITGKWVDEPDGQ